jgi:hypothetical protein
MNTIHWNSCSHSSLDRHGYCKTCGDLRRGVRRTRFPLHDNLKELARALKKRCTCHANNPKFNVPGLVDVACPVHGIEATRLRDARACVGATR